MWKDGSRREFCDVRRNWPPLAGFADEEAIGHKWGGLQKMENTRK